MMKVQFGFIIGSAGAKWLSVGKNQYGWWIILNFIPNVFGVGIYGWY